MPPAATCPITSLRMSGSTRPSCKAVANWWRSSFGAVQPGSPMVEMVPREDTLLIEARVKPADIAFVHVGQRAVVKVTAYDYSIFGGLEGHIEHVSADSIVPQQGEPYFVAHIRTTSNAIEFQGRSLSISPGMLATADVITGKRSVLHYLTKPINKARQRALTER